MNGMIKSFDISNCRDLRTRGNWWNLNVSETLYSRRMGKKIAKLEQEERRRGNNIAKLEQEERRRRGRSDPQRRSYGNENEDNMDGELQRFDVVKTCSDMWG